MYCQSDKYDCYENLPDDEIIDINESFIDRLRVSSPAPMLEKLPKQVQNGGVRQLRNAVTDHRLRYGECLVKQAITGIF